MKFAEDFESFLRIEVNLNQSRLDRLEQRVEAIESFLAADAILGEIFLNLIPAGSWAHRMIIRPVSTNDEFDADVLLHVDVQSDWLPRDYIEQLYTTFRGNSTYKPLAKRKTRCVRIDYAGDFHIDVVPYLERAGGHYITNRNEPEGEGRFEASEPEAFTAWIDERQRLTNGTFVKVVRLVKYLRDFKNTFTCRSIILTTLLGEQVNAIEAAWFPERYKDVPSMLNTLLGKLADALPTTMPAVMDPAGTGDDFTERCRDEWDYENFRSRIIAYADKVRAAYEEPDRHKAIAAWREVFGDDFKPGALTKAAELAPLSASVPRQGEQFIDQAPFGFSIQPTPQYNVHIAARCMGLRVEQGYRRNGFRQFDLAHHGNRVSKNRSLQFTAHTTVPQPYEVYWKVRNGGSEAADASQLRGEITPDQGYNVRAESTAYAGTHYVECYVVKDGVVVARDRHAVIVAQSH